MWLNVARCWLAQGKPDNIWGTRLSQASFPSISSVRPHNQSSTNLLRVHIRCSNYHHLNIKHLVGDFVANVSLMVRLSALYRFSNGSHIHAVGSNKKTKDRLWLMHLRNYRPRRCCKLQGLWNEDNSAALMKHLYVMDFVWWSSYSWYAFTRASVQLCYGLTYVPIPRSPRLNSTEVEKWSRELRSRPHRY